MKRYNTRFFFILLSFFSIRLTIEFLFVIILSVLVIIHETENDERNLKIQLIINRHYYTVTAIRSTNLIVNLTERMVWLDYRFYANAIGIASVGCP